jgi:L-alanine-DL-glutamate epimerase-like enolase superfamily enzyme
VKIVSIETFTRPFMLGVVRVRTDDGAEGWGQTAPYYVEQALKAMHSPAGISQFFLGKDPWDWEALVAEFTRKNHKHLSGYDWRALAGIDTAVYDLLGKVTGRPVYQLLGGAVRTRIPVYGSSMSRKTTPEEEADRMEQLRETHGFNGFKVRIADAMGHDKDVWPGRSEDVVKAVRERLGYDVILHADANGGYTEPEAIRMGRLLEDLKFGHFEEPCPYDDIASIARVSQALDIPIAGGEEDNSLPQIHRIITSHAVDIIQPDIGYVGGMARARKVMQMAEAAGMTATPHCANMSMLQVFTLHLAASQPSANALQEWSIEERAHFDGIYGPLPKVIDGFVELSDAPGWGVEILPDFLKSAEYDVTK